MIINHHKPIMVLTNRKTHMILKFIHEHLLVYISLLSEVRIMKFQWELQDG